MDNNYIESNITFTKSKGLFKYFEREFIIRYGLLWKTYSTY